MEDVRLEAGRDDLRRLRSSKDEAATLDECHYSRVKLRTFHDSVVAAEPDKGLEPNKA